MNSTALQPIGTALSAFQFSMTGTLFVGGLNHKDCWLPNSSGGSHWGTKYEATSGTLKDFQGEYYQMVRQCEEIAKGAKYVETSWGNANVSICKDRDAVQVDISPFCGRKGDSFSILMRCKGFINSPVYFPGYFADAELRFRSDRDEFSMRQFQHVGDKKIRATALSIGAKLFKEMGQKHAATGNEAWANALASIQDGKVTPMTACYIASMISKRSNSILTLCSRWHEIQSSSTHFYAQTVQTVKEGGYDCELFYLHERANPYYEMPKEMVRYVPRCSNAYADYPVIYIVHNALIHPQHFATDLIEGAVKMLPDTFPLAR